MTDRPTHLVDPVCGMKVEVAAAEAAGLLLEREGRTYAFCRGGCRRAFLEEPEVYIAKAEAASENPAPHAHPDTGTLPVIDQGMRLWYESCACCLSDAFPEIKAQLDAERAVTPAAAVDPGLCEVAEAEVDAVPLPG